MGYGYRVYRFSATVRRTRSKVDLAQTSGDAYIRTLPTVVESLTSSGVLYDKPNYLALLDEMPDPEQGMQAMRVREVTASGNRVSCEISHGTRGAHEDLLSDDVDEEIDNKAASRRYRFDFYFPQDGDTGILVAEANGGTCPVDLLLRWIARRHAEILGDIDGSWVKLQVEQIADHDYLLGLIRNSTKTQVRLIQTEQTARRKRTSRDRVLTINEISETQSYALAEEILHWARQDSDTAGAIRRTMRLLGLNRDKLREANMTFNLPEVRVEAPSGTKVIAPGQIQELFTYPLGDRRPRPDTWRSATRDRAHGLSVMERIPVEF
ncbi:hypothetical protein [Terrabacter terrigena]|uniref:Uncharacterized protein n=1 Tax=Terrabacter terrigena TaxID=574718 RepID=A0ABW3N100_9MICO